MSGSFCRRRRFFVRLWDDINEQFGSYIRGKFLEAVMVGTVTWYVFLFYNMDFSLALAVMVGLSVFVPFVGIIVVTFPVVHFGLFAVRLVRRFRLDYRALYFYSGVGCAAAGAAAVFAGRENFSRRFVASIIFFGNLWGAWGVFLADSDGFPYQVPYFGHFVETSRRRISAAATAIAAA